MELVYTHDLKSCSVRIVGSSPTPGTRMNIGALKINKRSINLKVLIILILAGIFIFWQIFNLDKITHWFGKDEAISSYGKIIPHPDGGIYLGQTQWKKGDIKSFEQAVGQKVALWSEYGVMSGQESDPKDDSLHFFPENALKAWNNGYIVLAGAFEPTPGRTSFTVDKLLIGEYDATLDRLAEEFKEFGRPLFFHTAREPNGAVFKYYGGYGPNGDKDFTWAVENKKGFTEFQPSNYPNPALYSGLGDPTVCDGAERFAAAQRYYYNFFVNKKGLDFITFDTMGWATPKANSVIEGSRLSHEFKLAESCSDFANLYPGDDYSDWVSITWYMFDDEEKGTRVPIQEHLDDLRGMMSKIRKVAPNKPVFVIETGAPILKGGDQEWQASKARAVLRELIKYQEIGAFAWWSSAGDLGNRFEFLPKPGTLQGDALKKVVSENKNYFHSCVYFENDDSIPNCLD